MTLPLLPVPCLLFLFPRDQDGRRKLDMLSELACGVWRRVVMFQTRKVQSENVITV